jgi:hypothetical protein
MERQSQQAIEHRRRLRWGPIVLVATPAVAVAWQLSLEWAFGDRHCALEDCNAPILLMLASFLALPVAVGALLALANASSPRTRWIACLASNGATSIEAAVVLFIQAVHAPMYGGPLTGSPTEELYAYAWLTVLIVLPISVMIAYPFVAVGSAIMTRFSPRRAPVPPPPLPPPP